MARWWRAGVDDRTAQVLLEGVLLLSMVVAGIGSLLAVIGTVRDRTVERSVPLAPEHVDLGPGAGGYSVEAATGTATLDGAGGGALIGSVAPQVLGAAVVVGTAYLLWRVVRSLREGDPFNRRNARRLTAAALIVMIGGTAVGVVDAMVGLVFATEAAEALGDDSAVAPGTGLSFLPIAIGLVLGVLAEVFRRGAAMREELEGLV
ncbi:MAG: DUF2975 domain-containing protein [Thermoleophilia bacterium]|nr:DUF2975 domain-containing protein [Thermoleophilia bacterium]